MSCDVMCFLTFRAGASLTSLRDAFATLDTSDRQRRIAGYEEAGDVGYTAARGHRFRLLADKAMPRDSTRVPASTTHRPYDTGTQQPETISLSDAPGSHRDVDVDIEVLTPVNRHRPISLNR